MTDLIHGRCLCGSIRFEFGQAPSWTCFCHCESCRRNTSSPVTAFLGLPKEAVRWAGPPAQTYQSGPGVTRSFCGRCGSPLAFESARWPGEIHLYIASLEDPERFKPAFHVHVAEKLSWLHLADELPRHLHNSQ